MHLEKVTFTGGGGATLSAWLTSPDNGDPTAYALVAHCFACNKNYHAVSNVSRVLTQAGLGVMRLDFTGLGESEGDFETTNFTSNVTDLLAAAEFLGRNYKMPSLLVGHSLGGTAVLQSAGLLPAVKAVATIAAPSEPYYVVRLLVGGREPGADDLHVTIGDRSFKITSQLLDDLEQSRMQETVKGLKRPLLVIHSAIDNTVGIDNGLQIFEWANHPKSFVGLDTADHLLANRADSAYVGGLIAHWASRYIPLSV